MNRILRRMAWRNLWRHKQRTVLMILSVALGSLAVLAFIGLTEGMLASMSATQIEWNQGSFQVRNVDYAVDPIPENGLTAEQVTAATEALADLRILGISPRLETHGMIRTSYGTGGVRLRGIDPAKESTVTHLDELVVEGSYLTDTRQILLSTAMAEDLDIRVGERIVILAIANDVTESQAFTVTGLFDPASFDLEEVAMMQIEDLRAMTGITGATVLAAALPRGVSVRRSVTRARAVLSDLPGVVVADYYDLNPFGRMMLSAARIEIFPMVIMISLLAGFGVANTSFYSVLERTREFGVMKAVGMNRNLLTRLVLLESTFVAAIGFVIGGGLGYWGLWVLSRTGISLSLVADISKNLGFPKVIYPSTSGWYIAAAFSVVVSTALTAAWYPARRVNRLNPVSAIREG